AGAPGWSLRLSRAPGSEWCRPRPARPPRPPATYDPKHNEIDGGAMGATGQAGPTGDRRIDAPSRSDWFIAGLYQSRGGPLGDHAVRQPAGSSGGRLLTAGRIVLALLCLTLALHWVQKGPCRDANWSDLEQLTKFCYSDIIALYGAENGLSQGGLPYLDYALEYPVLTGVFMTAVRVPVHA